MSDAVEPTSTSATATTTDDVIGVARLLLTLKEHNVTILLTTLVCYQIGLLDKVWTYSSGMC
jgi:hypothetical protein